MSDIWVDFNDIDRHGRTTSLTKFAKSDIDLSIGSVVLAGDHDGTVCNATVRSVDKRGIVLLSLDLGSINYRSLCTLSGTTRA